jgi:2-amino-4-hydroxy-6-hydroxymethyldihydropteridine diphosphokinase
MSFVHLDTVLSQPLMNLRVFIAIGSSALDGHEQVDRAVDGLRQHEKIDVVAVSPWFATAPVGLVQSRFINGVVEVATSLPPLQLLDALQKVERDLGRVPGDRWGPRMIDLDLLAYGDLELHDPRLHVPHPALWYRRFVLDPWEQIAGDWIVPCWEMSVADLRQRLLQRGLPVRLTGGDVESRRSIADEMNDQFHGMVTVTSVVEEQSTDTVPIRISLGYLPNSARNEADERWSINLTLLATELSRSIVETASFVLTAALDEPQELEGG